MQVFKSLRPSLSILIFITSAIIPFLFLSPLWAIIACVYAVILSPLLTQCILFLLMVIFKSKNGKSIIEDFPNIGYYTGGAEALILIMLSSYFTEIPTSFLWGVASIHTLNQINRSYRSEYGVIYFEISQLIGYLAIMISNTLFQITKQNIFPENNVNLFNSIPTKKRDE